MLADTGQEKKSQVSENSRDMTTEVMSLGSSTANIPFAVINTYSVTVRAQTIWLCVKLVTLE